MVMQLKFVYFEYFLALKESLGNQHQHFCAVQYNCLKMYSFRRVIHVFLCCTVCKVFYLGYQLIKTFLW